MLLVIEPPLLFLLLLLLVEELETIWTLLIDFSKTANISSTLEWKPVTRDVILVLRRVSSFWSAKDRDTLSWLMTFFSTLACEAIRCRERDALADRTVMELLAAAARF